MLTYPNFDPIAIELGPLKIHWYGIMYLVGFGLAWWLGRFRAKQPRSGWNEQQVGDLIFFGALGVILGGRIGYIVFYNFSGFMAEPLSLFKIWQGGMSFHGGVIGVIISMWLFGRKFDKRFFDIADFVAPLFPLGYAAGRIGNFINGELWGRVAEVPWAMVFPGAGPLPRHPSQLYQAFLEGIVVFLVLWFYSSRPRPRMAVSGMFLLLYGTFRFIDEFFRQPDAHLGFIAFGWLTMGQLLSVPMALGGIAMMWWSYRYNPMPKPASRFGRKERVGK